MLDFGWAELLIIIAVAVFVIGPKDIPNVMYGFGRLVRRFQYVKYAMSRQFDDMMQMHDVDELRRGVNFEDRSDRAVVQEIEHDEKLSAEPDQTQAHYSHIADQYHATFTQPSEYIEQFLELLPKEAHILDAGCGTGNNSKFLHDKGYAVTAIDFSDDMLAHAKAENPALNFQNMDLRDLKFETVSFDGVISAYSIIHLKKTELLTVLENFHRVLKEEGYLYLAFHSGESEEKMEVEPFNSELKFFLNVIDENEIKSLLKIVGFDVVDIFKKPSSFDEELPYGKMTIIAKKERV